MKTFGVSGGGWGGGVSGGGGDGWGIDGGGDGWGIDGGGGGSGEGDGTDGGPGGSGTWQVIIGAIDVPPRHVVTFAEMVGADAPVRRNSKLLPAQPASSAPTASSTRDSKH